MPSRASMNHLANGSEFKSCGDVLMIPMGMKGHIDPLLYIAKGLIKHGLTVTVVIQDDLRELFDADIEKQIAGLNIRTVPAVHVMWPKWAWENAMKALEPFLENLVEDRESGAPVPKCMVADMFQGWTQVWADKLKVPRYVSFPSPATFGLVMNHFSALMANGLLQGTDPNPVLDVPGAPVLHLSDLPPVVAKMPKLIVENGDTFHESAGMLFNTFYELESRAIDAFQARVEAISTREKVTKMYPIGPMLPAEYFREETLASSEDDSETIQWLNSRPKISVLYIAFGSMAYLSPAEIVELAHGLESSQTPFLWVLRVKAADGGEHVDVAKLLPPGFEARTKDRGLVWTEFAPQLQILSHAATGGFLTHCGWNSSLESICRGVPMIAWPMNAEQGLNCRILVDEAKVATEIKKGPDCSVVRGEVEKAVKHLMTEASGKQLKEKVLELQNVARMAIAPGGSSYTNLETLVKEIQSSSAMIQTQ